MSCTYSVDSTNTLKTTKCNYGNSKETTCDNGISYNIESNTKSKEWPNCSKTVDIDKVRPDSKNDFIYRFNNLAKEPMNENTKNKYIKLNDDLHKRLLIISTNDPSNNLIEKKGTLQQTIIKLENANNDLKVDMESAIARDDILRSRDTHISRHSLFMLDRPIRKGLIPYLWVVAIFFIGIGLIIFKMTMPSITSNLPLLSVLMNIITSRTVLGSLLGAALIVILFLSLKIGGVFGK